MSEFAIEMWSITIGGLVTLALLGIWYWWETGPHEYASLKRIVRWMLLSGREG